MDLVERTKALLDGVMGTARDIDGTVPEFVHENAIIYSMVNPAIGSKAFVEHCCDFLEAFPDMYFKRADYTRVGNVVTHSYTVSGTHAEELFGVDPTGKTISFDGISTHYFDQNGKITKYAFAVNFMHIFEQLGVHPSTMLKLLPAEAPNERAMLSSALQQLGSSQEKLTQIEVLCLAYHQMGLSAYAIAQRLGLFKPFVEGVIQNALSRLGCSSFSDLSGYMASIHHAHILDEFGKKLIQRKS